MQPYQDWALKFGEVLGRKLALAVNQGTWAVRLNLNPQTLGEIVVSLEVGERGLEGQLSSNDSAVRQLLSDALPKLRSSLEALLDQRGNVNILVDQEDSSKGKKPSRDMLEEFIDLEDEIFSGSEAIPGSGNMLRDGFDALV
jgi:flagellar hook-length control protein FliK